MGYDMYANRGTEEFHANIWSMAVLRNAMMDAGIDFSRDHRCKWQRETRNEDGHEVSWIEDAEARFNRLGYLFGSNDGWWVEPAICREIGEALPVQMDEEDHSARKINDFAVFCLRMAEPENDGFLVW